MKLVKLVVGPTGLRSLRYQQYWSPISNDFGKVLFNTPASGERRFNSNSAADRGLRSESPIKTEPAFEVPEARQGEPSEFCEKPRNRRQLLGDALPYDKTHVISCHTKRAPTEDYGSPKKEIKNLFLNITQNMNVRIENMSLVIAPFFFPQQNDREQNNSVESIYRSALETSNIVRSILESKLKSINYGKCKKNSSCALVP